ncbi:MAG: GNAT family N-acetyltransferase, partial [Thermoanaerobaculia bacterium]|nr:GNAT family N-acetyltransferase [Thermoanaerobaculia bacterium]
PEFWREEIPRLAEVAAAGQGAWFLLSRREDSEGSLVGRCAITNLVRGAFQAGHLGFALAKPAEGQGLMYEALLEVVRFAFGELGLHRLMANYRPENERSARLLARLGFRIEGLAKDYLHLDGAWRDHVLTARVHPEWRAP